MQAQDALRLVNLLVAAEEPVVEGLPPKVLVRTVTHYHVGRVVSVNDGWIVLDDASWVADTGRFSDALLSGSLNEVEPFGGRVWINRGAVIDLTEWRHDLPTATQ